MEVIARGTVFKGEEQSDRQSSAFPSICVLPNRRWLCSFRAAPSKLETRGQHVLLTWSDDQGRTWSKPHKPFSPPDVNGKPGLFRSAQLTSLGGANCIAVLCWVEHSNPDLPFFNEETEGLLDTKIFLTKSNDGGENWSLPELVDTSPFNVPTPITGPMLLLPSGEWACQFELNKHYNDPEIWRHSSVLLFSKDEGRTWTEHSIASNDPTNRIFYWDQRPNVMADGTILDLFWTYDNASSTYLNIHARMTSDRGLTWSDYLDVGVPGQPASPVSLNNGNIGMVYIDRTYTPTLKARISEDGGATWPENTESILYVPEPQKQNMNKKTMQDAWSEMGKFSVGLPSTAQINSNETVVVYYAGLHSDHTAIEWVHVNWEDL